MQGLIPVIIYPEKATIFCKIFPLLLIVKSKGKISQKFVAFSEYMNFTKSLEKNPESANYCTYRLLCFWFFTAALSRRSISTAVQGQEFHFSTNGNGMIGLL